MAHNIPSCLEHSLSTDVFNNGVRMYANEIKPPIACVIGLDVQLLWGNFLENISDIVVWPCDFLAVLVVETCHTWTWACTHVADVVFSN